MVAQKLMIAEAVPARSRVDGRGMFPAFEAQVDDAVATFPAEASSIPLARVWVCLEMARRRPAHDWGTVTLLVGELATNAVMHATTESFTVCLDFIDGIEAAVHDQDPTPPTVHRTHFGEGGGRGLALVESIADAWGTRVVSDGKWVWFRLDSRR